MICRIPKYIIILVIIMLNAFPVHSQQNLSSYIFHIEKIEIEGNTKTSNQVVFENLSFAVGDSLSEAKIHEGIEKLNNLEIFSKVILQPKLGSTPGNLIIKLIIEERYWPHIRFKGGYNELEGWFLTPISLNFDNLFGIGNFMSMDLTMGDRINAVNINYLNPNIFDSDLDFILRASGRQLNFVHFIKEKKWILSVDQSGLFIGVRSRDEFLKNFTFGLDLYSTTADTFGWRYKSDDRLYEFPTEISRFMGEKIKSSNFNIQFNYDLRDHARYPASGMWIGGKIEFADKQIGSDFNFTRYIFDVRKYQILYNKIVGAARIKYGYISHDSPFYEKFYLGGPNSLRGYSDRSLSPFGGGNQLFQAGVELRFPIAANNYPKHLFTGVLFYDAGGNIQSKNMFNFEEVKSSYGFGLRVNIPFLGIVRADYGIPTDGNEKRIQFSLGHSF
jgi:outer membrane protein insertion porin family